MEPTLLKYRKDNYSQNGEDGVIKELFNRLEINEGYFCEFGAWDGKKLSNTYNLVKNSENWKGILIEGDSQKFKELENTVSDHPKDLIALNKYVSSSGDNSLDNILEDTPIPKDFELLSIDIDGPDYFVWQNFKKYKPKVVIIEINPELGPEIRFISEMRHNGRFEITPDKTNFPSNFPKEREGEQIRMFGTSFKSMIELGRKKGYVPVSCTKHNVIFVLETLVDKVGLKSIELENPSVLFKTRWREPETPTPFYKKSIQENFKLFLSSVKEKGIVRTVEVAASKILDDLKSIRIF